MDNYTAKAIVKQYRVTRGCLLAVLLALVFLTAFLVRDVRYMLAFGLFENTADIPADAYQTTEIEVDGNTCYFSVLTVYPDESVTE